jgi:hypothetical protein
MSVYIYKVSSRMVKPLGIDAPVRLCSYYCNANQIELGSFAMSSDKTKHVERIEAAHNRHGDAKYIAVGDQFGGSSVYIPKHDGVLLDDVDFGTHIGILLKVRGKYKMFNKAISNVYLSEIKLNEIISGRINSIYSGNRKMNPDIYRDEHFLPLLNKLSLKDKSEYSLINIPR